MSKELIERIRTKKARIAVLGLGHVGLPTATIFADAGYSVTGTDIKKEVVDAISSLKLDTKEPRLDEMVERGVRTGKLKAVADTALATKQADVMLVCVQTPLTESREPDLSYLGKASLDVARGLMKGKLVVVVSTVPPGAVKNLVARILEGESGLKCGGDFWLAYCPERILPGKTIQEFAENVRLVGGFDSQSAEITVELFKGVTRGKILVTDIANAELAKLAENTFRYVNIAFANELALICEKMGADAVEVINLANTHPRVNIHMPGPGVGGPCLAKDPQLLLHPVEQQRLQSKIMESSRSLNDYMAVHVLELIIEALKQAKKDLRKAKIAVLGVAYKGEVSDTTNSPAESIIHGLMNLGVHVKVYDPYSEETFGGQESSNVMDALRGTDCMLIVTNHKVFANASLKKIKVMMNDHPIIVDARRIINSERAKEEGFTYYGIGYGYIRNAKPFVPKGPL